MPDPSIRNAVRGFYDLQKLRIGAGNRVTVYFKQKLGIDTTEKEETQDNTDLLTFLRGTHKRITDRIAEQGRKKKPSVFEADGGPISNMAEYSLVSQYVSLLDAEITEEKLIHTLAKQLPLWDYWLKDVKGVGPVIAAILVSEIDIEKAKYVTNIWSYAGLDVGPDGRGRSRRKEHLVKRKYTDKEGVEKERDSITFNPFLKTKLIGVLGPSLIKQSEGHYRQIYLNYKHRLENRPDLKDSTKGHRNNMAIRYMVKQFLADLYNKWRQLEGLPIEPPYHEAKLGMKHTTKELEDTRCAK